MKKLIFCATLVMLITSCMKNDIEVEAVQRTEDFTATFEDGTRADLDGTAVVWNDDDHLTIFTKTSHNRQYKVKDLSANGRSATFEYVGYTGSDKTPITNNYAVYPYNTEATILGDVITTTLASEQIYNAERDLTYALMSAKSATNNFSFVNSGALLRFNVSTILPDTFDLNYIKVSSQSHNIAGEVTIDTNNHLAVVANNGTNEITLAEINEAIDSDIKSFYIAMPAMSFEKSDLSVTFSFTDGDKTFALPAFDLEQGKIKSIDYSIKDADEFTGSTPGEDEPAAAKPANNEIWYTNGSATEATTPYKADVFGANIVSNTYDAEKECWVIKFDGDVTTIGNYAFEYCSSLTSVTIPDSVTAIGDRAFDFCSSLTSVTIPDSVTTIGRWAFSECSSLTSVTIGDSVTTIGNYAFRFCRSLTSVTIPDSVTTIGDGAFEDCSSLTSVTIPDSVTTIGDYAFYGCRSLTSLTIPDSVTTIGDYAFYGCRSLTSLTIPDSVTTIGRNAFLCCTGELVVNCNIPSASSYSYGAFYDSNFTSVTIGDSVTKIGDYAFYDCNSLTSITITDSVTTIGSSAFCGCNSLTSVTIGDNVTTIGEGAFYSCSSLTSVTIGDSVTTIGDGAFWNCSSLIEFNGKYASEDGRCLIVDGSLNSFAPAGLTEYAIPDSVTTIGEGAFYDCSSLTSVTIPDSVTSIGRNAFNDCSRLTSVTIPDSVTTIGGYAFRGCSSLTSVTIGDSVTTIGSSAFGDCISLTSVTIPDSVTTIGGYAFRGCSSLTSVTIGDSVTTIGSSAFGDCISLTSVTIPDSVTTIEECAFSGCSYNLQTITIGKNVTTIGPLAFDDCRALTNVYCKATTPPAGSSQIFPSNVSDRKIYVPMESVEAYKSASNWIRYANEIVGYDF